MAELMSFEAAKLVINSFAAWQDYKNGMSIPAISIEQHVSVKEVEKRIKRTEYYIRNQMLDWELTEARKRITEGTVRVVSREEELPVRCASGCRFSPLN